MREIKENKRIYLIKADTATTGKIKEIFYGGAESCHHKKEREIHLIKEQVAAIISEREKIHHERAE
jgi:hypothetical protein